MIYKVRIGSLDEGDIFETALTRRVGFIVHPIRASGPEHAKQSVCASFEDGEERWLHKDVCVIVTRSPSIH